MQKNIFLVFIFLLIECQVLFAQPNNNSGYCGSDLVMVNLFKENQEVLGLFENTKTKWAQFASVKASGQQGVHKSLGGVANYLLPIVFHDLTSTQNIYNTTTLLQSFIDSVNGTYISQVGIEFCLAKVDYLNNPVTSSTASLPSSLNGVLDNNDQAQIDTTSKVIQQTGKFPPNKFINVYVVDDIASPVAGFAFGPSAHGNFYDGIYLEKQYVESFNLNDNLVVFLHEMGHYLGLLHTFGRCQPTFSECSCTNTNCLLDGDMVCDTPPDSSTLSTGNCSSINTCSTDASPVYYGTTQLNPFAFDFVGNGGIAMDANDRIDNFMDYGDWSCQDSFTNGQSERMCFMIDPIIGPRNSLLNSNFCNALCAVGELCEVNIDTLPLIQILGVDYYNTLVLNSSSVSFNFTGQVTNCANAFNDFEWIVTNLDNDFQIGQGSGTSISINFTEVGNFQIEYTASINGSNPLCFKTHSLNIQVVPPPLNGGNCVDVNWNDFHRIEYQGGWVHADVDPTTDIMRDTSSTGPIYLSSPNDTTNSSPFAIINTAIPLTDSVFGGLSLPPNVDEVFRVGRVIDGSPLANGTGDYVTYTFIPTEEQAKIRVWYLGLRDDQVSASIISYGFFSNPYFHVANSFGMVFSGNTLISGGTPVEYHRDGTSYNIKHNNFDFGRNSSYYNTFVPRIPITILGQNYSATDGWGYYDIDLQPYVCENSPVTLTFYARTNSAVDGFHHSYAYFGLQCLPSVLDPPIEFDIPNVNLNCLPDANEICHSFSTLIEGSHLISNSYGQLPAYLKKFNISKSNDGVNFGPYFEIFGTQTQTTSPEISFSLCKASDTVAYSHYRIRYETPCRIYEDSFYIHQGFTYELNLCQSASNLVNLGGDLLNAQQSSVIHCDTTIVNMTKPCWWQSGMNMSYRWQVKQAGAWADILGETSEEFSIYGSHFTLPFFLRNGPCRIIRRVAEYDDPYCGQKIWIPSEEFRFTSTGTLVPSYFLNTQNDVCLGDSLHLEIDYNQISQNCLIDTPNNSMTVTMKDIFGLSIVGVFKDVNGNVLASNVNTYTYQYFGIDVPKVYFSYLHTPSFSELLSPSFSFFSYGCAVSRFFNFSINVKESAIGGIVTYDPCSEPQISTINTDNNNNYGYQWEYSYDGGTTFNLYSATEDSAELDISTFAFTSYPVVFRRKANGTQDCPDVAYSNSITIFNPVFIVSLPNDTICSFFQQGDTVSFGSQLLFTEGIYLEIFQSIQGCDSIVVLILNEIPPNDSLSACDFAEISGDWYFVSQLVEDTFTSASGCDSIIFTELIIHSTYLDSMQIEACDSAEISGAWYFVSQLVEDTFTSTSGCDSIIVTELIIHNSYLDPMQIEACDSAEINGAWYFVSQLLEDTFIGASGCDSIIVTELIIHNTYLDSIQIEACDSAEINGKWFVSSQLIEDTFLTTFDCDSFIVTELMIHNSYLDSMQIEACDSAEIHGNWYFASQIVQDTFSTVFACDSVIVTALTIHNSYLGSKQIEACDSAEINGNWYFASQLIIDKFETAQACDSIIITELTINSSYMDSVEIEACDSITLNNVVITSSGLVRDTLQTIYNCDSVVEYNVTIVPSIELLIFDTIFQEETYTLPGGLIVDEPGLYATRFPSSENCDSIVHTNLTIINRTIGSFDWYVYPSLSDDLLSLYVDRDLVKNGIQVVIYNILGQVIYLSIVHQPITEIPVENWSKGAYIVVLYKGNSYLDSKKVLIAK